MRVKTVSFDPYIQFRGATCSGLKDSAHEVRMVQGPGFITITDLRSEGADVTHVPFHRCRQWWTEAGQ